MATQISTATASTTESTTATATAALADAPAKKFVEKPEKPDEDKFKAEREKIEKRLQDIKEKLKVVQDKISQVEPPRSNNGERPAQNAVQKRQSELRAELSSIKNAQAGFNNSKQKVHDQIKTLDASLQAKLTEQEASKLKIPFKSVAEIDSAIASLEEQVESGRMKIVKERIAVYTIKQYRRHRKTLQSLDADEDAIASEKAKIAELETQLVEDPEQKKLSDRYNEITAELDKIKAEQDEVYKNLSSLRDDRTELRKQENEQRDEKRKLEREFYAAKDKYRAYEKEAYERRKEKVRAEREARDKEYKRQIAAEKMEAASQPAFQAEINTCEGLIAHFDPTSPESQAAKSKASLLKDAGLKALATRVVETEPKGKKLVKEEEDYFVGKPKKGKKGSTKGSGAAAPTVSSNSDEKDNMKGKFQLNHRILVELGTVDVGAPTKWDDVPACVEKLREKLTWYKENSERVTKENIAKAQKEIDRLEGGNGKEEEVKSPVAEEETLAEPEEEEEEEEEEKPLPVPATTEETNEEEKTE